MFSYPDSLAMKAAPITPAAGPDSTRCTGCRLATLCLVGVECGHDGEFGAQGGIDRGFFGNEVPPIRIAGLVASGVAKHHTKIVEFATHPAAHQVGNVPGVPTRTDDITVVF